VAEAVSSLDREARSSSRIVAADFAMKHVLAEPAPVAPMSPTATCRAAAARLTSRIVPSGAGGACRRPFLDMVSRWEGQNTVAGAFLLEVEEVHLAAELL